MPSIALAHSTAQPAAPIMSPSKPAGLKSKLKAVFRRKSATPTIASEAADKLSLALENTLDTLSTLAAPSTATATATATATPAASSALARQSMLPSSKIGMSSKQLIALAQKDPKFCELPTSPRHSACDLALTDTPAVSAVNATSPMPLMQRMQ
ncbi:hypothetical protein BC831DRAFT_451244 [Entophlyctis helioformis]|nr:hypothetical protein BC831DRAFT_451244 [Entophlyctis helioformis]